MKLISSVLTKTFITQPEFVFLVLALPFGLLLVFLTPPFQVPDEPSHFFRAWEISEGKFSPVREGDLIGANLPESIFRLAGTFSYLIQRTEARTTPTAIVSAREIRLGTDRMVAKSNATIYLPVGYIPQAAAILIARLVTDRPLDLLYAARISNFLVSTILCLVAIRVSPVFRWVLLVVALLPISVFMRSSVSIDALVNSLAMLIFALATRFVLLVAKSDLVKLVFTAFVFSLLKPYGTLSLIVLGRTDAWKRYKVGLIGLIVAVGAATMLLLVNASQNSQPFSDQVSAPDQARLVFSDPIRFLYLLTTDYIEHGPRYAAHMGRLGWLDTQVPLWIVAGCLIAVLALALTDFTAARSLSRIERLAIVTVVLANLTIVALSQYLTWTPLGANEISGMQGRYFLPIVPFALLLLSSRRLSARVSEGAKASIASLASTFSLLATTLTLWTRYYAL